MPSAKGEPTPENGYAGSYISEVAARVLWTHPGLPDEPADDGARDFPDRPASRKCWPTSGSRSTGSGSISTSGSPSARSTTSGCGGDQALAAATFSEGHTYESEGALWLRTTDFGDDKDRVLVKSDGDTSYFTSDAAYYLDKRERGFERCIYMLGADHHGYVGRLRAMVCVLRGQPGRRPSRS